MSTLAYENDRIVIVGLLRNDSQVSGSKTIVILVVVCMYEIVVVRSANIVSSDKITFASARNSIGLRTVRGLYAHDDETVRFDHFIVIDVFVLRTYAIDFSDRCPLNGKKHEYTNRERHSYFVSTIVVVNQVGFTSNLFRPYQRYDCH